MRGMKSLCKKHSPTRIADTFTYLYACVTYMTMYIVKEVASLRGLGQLMAWQIKECALELQTSRKNVKLQLILIAVVYSRDIIKMMQEYLTIKKNAHS